MGLWLIFRDIVCAKSGVQVQNFPSHDAPHLAPLARRSANGLGKDGGAAVAGALGRLTGLTELDLG
jgi:hypothetical protein